LKYILLERKNYYLNQLILGIKTNFFFFKKKTTTFNHLFSYYNWENQTCCTNNTPNFQIIPTSLEGLLFKSKRDRKIIDVDPKARSHGDNTVRIEIKSDKYIQVAVYRHSTRRKT
jgi:hypothetical protein